MRFIQGIGYVDDVNTAYPVSSTTQPQTTPKTSFDSLLAAESEKLNNQGSTYNLDDIFREASEKYNVSYDLLKAIAYTESRFQADATSSSGAMGIMQLMPSTASSLGVTDAYDPYQNIMGGAKLLHTLSDMYDGNQTLMIAAYNAGSGNVAKYGGVPPFQETQNYVSKVLDALQSTVNVPNTTVFANGGMSAVNIGTTAAGIGASSTNYYTDILSSNLLYGTGSRQNDLSYQEYELLMTYFDTMMDIISSIGETDSDSSDSFGDDSLSDLFKLSAQQNTLYRTTL